jgi:hypothetical protein
LDLGYVEECAYLENILENIRREKKELDATDGKEGLKEEVQERLDMAEVEESLRDQAWRSKISQIRAEKEVALNDLDLKYRDARKELDKTWRSKAIAAKFNKPSLRLMELRLSAQRTLTAHRFEEAKKIAAEAKRREAFEAQEAGRQRDSAYRQAVRQLEAKFEKVRNVLEHQFELKESHIEKCRQRSLLPLTKVVEKFTNKKSALVEAEKTNSSQKRKKELLRTMPPRTDIRPYTTLGRQNATLKLPPVKVLRRNFLDSRWIPATSSSGSRISQSTSKQSGRMSRLKRSRVDSDSDK